MTAVTLTQFSGGEAVKRTLWRFASTISLFGIIVTYQNCDFNSMSYQESSSVADATPFNSQQNSNTNDLVATTNLSLPAPLPVESFVTTIPSTGWQTSMELRFYRPVGQTKYPVVIFCSGSDGSNISFPETSEFIAANGYTVVHTSWTGTAQHIEKTINRARDVGVALDALAQMGYSTQNVGAMGHSSGATIAQVVGGALVEGVSYRDGRVAAVLMLSGSGSGEFGLTPDSWKDFVTPLIQFTGSRDFGAYKQPAYPFRREAYDFSPPGNKQLVWYDEGHHGSYSGKFTFNAQQAAIFEHAHYTALKYFDAYLKNDPEAIAYIRSDAPNSYNAAKLTYEYK